MLNLPSNLVRVPFTSVLSVRSRRTVVWGNASPVSFSTIVPVTFRCAKAAKTTIGINKSNKSRFILLIF